MAPLLFSVMLHEPQAVSPAPCASHLAVSCSGAAQCGLGFPQWFLDSFTSNMVAAFPEAGSSSYLPGESLPRTAVRSLVLPSVCHSLQEPSHLHCADSTCRWERGRSGCRMRAIVVPSHSLPPLTTSMVPLWPQHLPDPSRCCVPHSHLHPSTSLSSSLISRLPLLLEWLPEWLSFSPSVFCLVPACFSKCLAFSVNKCHLQSITC